MRTKRRFTDPSGPAGGALNTESSAVEASAKHRSTLLGSTPVSFREARQGPEDRHLGTAARGGACLLFARSVRRGWATSYWTVDRSRSRQAGPVPGADPRRQADRPARRCEVAFSGWSQNWRPGWYRPHRQRHLRRRRRRLRPHLVLRRTKALTGQLQTPSSGSRTVIASAGGRSPPSDKARERTASVAGACPSNPPPEFPQRLSSCIRTSTRTSSR